MPETDLIPTPKTETDLKNLIEKAEADSKTFLVKSDEDYIEADKRRKALSNLDKFVHDLLDEERDLAHKSWKRLVAKVDGYLSPVETARRAYKTAMAVWDDKKEQARLAEQRRLMLEAKEKADAEALEAARAAEKAGDKQTAAAIIEEAAQAPAPFINVEKSLPKATSTVFRTFWSATITDPNFVKNAIAKAGAMLAKSKNKDAQEAAELLRRAFEDVQDMVYDQVKLNRLAAATKGAITRGGVTFSSRKV